MLSQCELCRGLRGHARLLQDTYELFDAEYRRSVVEWQCLLELFRDVCWYSFETKCRDWRDPWFATLGDSRIELFGIITTRHGHAEVTDFPPYYIGPISDAPSLPIEIVLLELQAAYQYMLEKRKERTACYDYAPGGRAYEQLLREGSGVRAYQAMASSRSSETSVCGGCAT